MKIVINSCFGGFSLSPRAVKRMAELQGKDCYFFKGYGKNIKPCTLENLEKSDTLMWYAFDLEDPSEIVSACDSVNWIELPEEERKRRNDEYEKHSVTDRDIERNNPLLVRIVEELGEKANGSYACLKIVEIPDDVEWEIEEYDGNEHISEKHRTWA